MRCCCLIIDGAFFLTPTRTPLPYGITLHQPWIGLHLSCLQLHRNHNKQQHTQHTAPHGPQTAQPSPVHPGLNLQTTGYTATLPYLTLPCLLYLSDGYPPLLSLSLYTWALLLLLPLLRSPVAARCFLQVPRSTKPTDSRLDPGCAQRQPTHTDTDTTTTTTPTTR